MATFTKLARGSRGEEVKRLQTALNRGGAGLAVDGVFGPKTDAAVRDYQSRSGLQADGVVGEQTWSSLERGPVYTTQPVQPVASTMSGGGVGRVSDETARTLERYEKGYTPAPSVTAAEEAWRQAAAARPGDYDDPYAPDLDALYGQIAGRRPFSYDLQGDPLYHQYRQQYQRLGRRAMEDTQGAAASLTGGYGSTYAQGAGQQAYEEYLRQLNDKVPDLYRAALERYKAEGDELYRRYGLLSDRDAAAYSRYRDAMGDYLAAERQAYSRYQDQRGYDYDQWSDMLRYWQNKAEGERSDWWQQTKFDYQRERDALTDARRAAGGSGRSSGGSGRSSGGKTASAAARDDAAAPASAAPQVYVPGYGVLTYEQAQAMVRSGNLEWVMKDNRRDHLTEEGRWVARMRKPPVSGGFDMIR